MALFLESPGHGSRQINALMLLVVCVGLVFSLAWQGMSAGYACPLCTLQRMALILAGVGLLLNVRLGPSPLHYAMTITSALAGIAICCWLALLPAESNARLLMGLRLHSWAFAIFGVLAAFALLMQTLDRRWGDNAIRRTTSLLGTAVMALFLVAALASAAGTVMDCGVSMCLKSLSATL